LLRVLALNYSTNLDGPDAEKWAGEFEVELERRGGEMASLLAHRLRAVVHDGPDRDRSGPVSVNDSQAALREISLLCVTASAVADRFLIRAGKLEPGDALVGGCVDLRLRSGPPRPRAAIPEPPLVSLTAGSPLEVLAIVPPEVIAGGGFAALLTLAMRVATFPVRVAERWEFYRYERVRWLHERTRIERLLIEEQAQIVRANARRLAPVALDLLDPEDQYGPTVAASADDGEERVAV
jgi:hypothetical protein